MAGQPTGLSTGIICDKLTSNKHDSCRDFDNRLGNWYIETNDESLIFNRKPLEHY